MCAASLELLAADNPAGHPQPSLEKSESGHWCARFEAMASPCEILIDTPEHDFKEICQLVKQAVIETWRIEEKYSRYRPGNLVDQINKAQGQTVEVDSETAGLLDYAEQCFTLSDGLFDITSGPLRRIWRFQGDQVASPNHADIQAILDHVGWQKVVWKRPFLTLPLAGEVDFGGIVKEYAVDKVCTLLTLNPATERAALVNFGGDLCCGGYKKSNQPWRIGLDSIAGGLDEPSANPVRAFKLERGAIATSGDTFRHIYFKGQKLSHLLNPKTGWPIFGAPQTVTVVAPTCTLAGMLASFAMLHGTGAEDFLKEQGVQHWIQRATI